ncbi:MAG TPA: hypothetical protein VEP91_08015 [Solirubrobacterales bacterium]|nr:hypothetical protein [Solirubrobacterales bacterium]
MSRVHGRYAIGLAGLAALALVLPGCALFKEGSLSLEQPGGTGPVNLRFELCTRGEGPCESNKTEGQSQYMLGIAIPKGSSAPQTLRAQSVNTGAAISYTRNEEVTAAIAEALAAEKGQSWPPPGSEAAGYLSGVFTEETGSLREWEVNASLPLPAGDTAFAGPFKTVIVTGWRKVDGTHSADRPVNCYEPGVGMEDGTAGCFPGEEKELGTADLRIAPHQPLTDVFVGGRVEVPFDFDYASTASLQPAFSFPASSALPGAALTPATATFATGPLPADTHRVGSSGAVTVQAPTDAQPGIYDVTLTATTAAGVATSATAKLRVVQATIGVGKPKLNRKRGTALLPVTVPGAGVLSLKGAAIRSVQKRPQGARTLKVLIKARGKAKKRLARTGKVRIVARLEYKPEPGVPAKSRRAIVLKQSG